MAVLTNFHKVNLVNSFIKELEANTNSYYVFVGKPDPWRDVNGFIDETAIPPANNSITQINQLIYHDIVFGKKIFAEDVIAMAKRNDWKSGVVYARYDNDDPDLVNKNYYVITDVNEVYKCINNGVSAQTPNGVPSIVKPTITQTSGTFQTSDGYIWKYMFTVGASEYSKFHTKEYFPITPNNAVIENVVPGTIDDIDIISGGKNYQIYVEGVLNSFVNNFVVQLPSNTSPVSNVYNGSSIYLKSGFGAGQTRKVSQWDAANRLLAVSNAFSYYENLKLANTYGTFMTGLIGYQKVASITYYNDKGFINLRDLLIQTDTQASGYIWAANTTTVRLDVQSNTEFINSYPIFNAAYSAVKKNGKVDVDLSSNALHIIANTATSFTTDFAVGDYIRVGENANTNMRRVSAVNSSVIVVETPFAANVIFANCYSVNSAFTVESISTLTSRGEVVYVNINSAEIRYSNTTPQNRGFLLGESVILVDETNTSQGANGTVSYANSSTLILSNVQGPITANLYLLGVSSKVKAYIQSNLNYPNITIEMINGAFRSGMPVYLRTANNINIANAYVISKYTSPNDQTEFVIGPTVRVEGDGNGALAYAVVDLSSNNASRSITDIKIVSPGQGYTVANVFITANNLYGTGAVAKAVISPVKGHGYDPYSELACSFVGISKKLETGVSEGFQIPTYGSYRQIGIMKNPLIEDAIFTVENLDSVSLTIANTNGVTFERDEIVVQPASNSAGVVNFANSTKVELRNVRGTFNQDANNFANSSTVIYGWKTNANAYVTIANTKFFTLPSALEDVLEINSGGGSGKLNQVITNTSIRLTEVKGSFDLGDRIYEPTTNAYANIIAIYASNGTVNAGASFGRRFNQTARLALTSNTIPFVLYEYVYQEITGAEGRIISTNDEVDINYIDPTNFAVGDQILNINTGATGYITHINANNQYLRVASVTTDGFDGVINKSFKAGDHFSTADGTKIAIANNVFSVLVLDDVISINNANTTAYLGKFQIGSYQVIGKTSGAVGTIQLSNAVRYPDLIRESGEVLYLENLSKFDRTAESTEQLKIVVKF